MGFSSVGGGDGIGVGVGGAGGGAGEGTASGFMGGCVGVTGVCGITGVSLGVTGSVGLIGGGEDNSPQATNNITVLRAMVRSKSEIFFCRVKRLGDIDNLLIMYKNSNLNYIVIV